MKEETGKVNKCSCCQHISSVQFSCSAVSDSLWSHGLQHTMLPYPSPTPIACSNSCPLFGDAIQPSHPLSSPSHPLSSPSPPSFNLSQHHGLFQWVSSSHQVDKVLELQLEHHSFNVCSGLIYFKTDWFDLLAVQGTLKSSPTPQFKSINSLVLSFLYSPTLTSIHDHWKNHCFD